MLRKIFFITGTDTNIGKTYITVGLLKTCAALNLQAIGLKPIATGCEYKNNQLLNHDALLLQENSTATHCYRQINPIAFKIASAPNIAANAANITLKVAMVIEKIMSLQKENFDFLFIEGIGGWQVPINSKETMADLVKAINCSVILVVGLRLGCINHALLTYQSIIAHDLTCAGWIGNCIDPTMQYSKENIATIKQFINAPHLATIKYGAVAQDHLNIDLLL